MRDHERSVWGIFGASGVSSSSGVSSQGDRLHRAVFLVSFHWGRTGSPTASRLIHVARNLCRPSSPNPPKSLHPPDRIHDGLRTETSHPTQLRPRKHLGSDEMRGGSFAATSREVWWRRAASRPFINSGRAPLVASQNFGAPGGCHWLPRFLHFYEKSCNRRIIDIWLDRMISHGPESPKTHFQLQKITMNSNIPPNCSYIQSPSKPTE